MLQPEKRSVWPPTVRKPADHKLLILVVHRFRRVLDEDQIVLDRNDDRDELDYRIGGDLKVFSYCLPSDNDELHTLIVPRPTVRADKFFVASEARSIGGDLNLAVPALDTVNMIAQTPPLLPPDLPDKRIGARKNAKLPKPDYDGVDWESLLSSPLLTVSQIAKMLREPVKPVRALLDYWREKGCFDVFDESGEQCYEPADVLVCLVAWKKNAYRRLKIESEKPDPF
jgi:hypothetical protein